MTDDPEIRGLYSPSRKQVACALLAAAYKIDTRIHRMFDPQDWFLAPVDDAILITAPVSEWEYIANLPRNERPGPENFAHLARPGQPTEAR